VDDCSPDGSWTKLLSLKEKLPDIKLIKHWSNQGVVGAIKSGLLEANGDLFTILAPDLQDPPELLMELSSLWKSGYKMAVAVRATRDDPSLSKMFSKLYYILLRLVVCHDYPKGGFDLGVWDKAYIKPILSCRGNKNIALFTWSLGVPAATIKYHRRERLTGKSSWSFYKKLHYFMDSFVGMSAKPLRIACAFAFLVSLLALTGAIGIVGWNILFYSEIPRIAVFASAILILFSAIFAIFGILGEYIWRLYESTTIYKEGLKTTILNNPH
jgi:dolichol-phosphate mannosyltransferase